MTDTHDSLRGIEDRLLVVETRLNYLATKAELVEQIGKLRDDLRTAIFVAVAPMYALLIGLLITVVFFLLPRVPIASP